ncbi:LysR family transcriptional regulator [Silvimonas iriomotensis]|uniref:LysR family transcriptional regulator n=2 Tax=Silvimonas iriomotensis TaxID=449662 RepID=A0ABQ2P922_9NEIS|nr:LysR family transcriptional regulator [Silvimonas iriomotensis]
MELRDLRAFVTLADLLHFTEAADRLHVTQSALSKQIKRLESDLGGALFSRSNAGTQLTPLGRDLLTDAHKLVNGADALAWKARASLGGNAGTLRIGFGVGTKVFVPAAISRFRAARPEVQIELNDLSSQHQIQALIEGRLDLAFCRLPAPTGWPHIPVVVARFIAIIPASWSPALTLAELASQPVSIIDHHRAPAFHAHLMNYLAGQDLRVAQIQPVQDFVSVVALAAAGIAWGIVPSSTSIDDPGVRIMPLTDPAASWLIGLMRPPGKASALVAAFWGTVEEMLGDNALATM